MTRPTLTILAFVALVAAGCGIPTDDTPRELPIGAAPPPSATASSPSTAAQGGTDFAYYLADERLVPVPRDLESTEVNVLVGAALQDPTESERAAGIGSRIPGDTEVVSVVRTAADVSLELSSGFARLEGAGRVQAAGQILLTLAQVPGVSRIRVTVGGEPLEFSTPSGSSTVLDRCDLIALLGTPQDASKLGDIVVRSRLNSDRRDLQATCTVD